MAEGGTKEARLKHLEEQLDTEEKAWQDLGINLNMINFSGEQIFELQAKLQAITNCMLDNDLSEINLNIHLKEILYESMKGIREGIEPQVKEAQLAMLQRAIVPEIKMPWNKGNGG